jgi:DNA-binding transcriptional regulator YhcF (GntR family)
MGIDLGKPVPLYRQIADDFRSRIVSGDIPLGARLESHREICIRYGVSLITVRKAVLLLSQEGLLISRAGMGTFVAHPSPARPANRCLGLVLSDLRSPFFSLIVHAAEAAAYRSGFNVMLSNSSGEEEKE